MLKNMLILSGLAVLTACGDPLRDLPRLSDVDVAEATPVSRALPSEAEIAREGYFGTASVSGGLFDSLRGGVPAIQPNLRAQGGSQTPIEGAQTDDFIEENAKAAQVASLAPDARAQTNRRRGLFGGIAKAASSGIDAQDVPFGTVLPYGTVARVCDARRQSLGKKIESASASGYKLYDSNPAASGPRTYYITGFADNCPRQLTAAHVVLGSPSFYELLHYGPTGAHLVTGETDRAYEKVKGRVCGVRKGKPCGSRMRQLERGTFFVNAYERMDDNTRWSEMLVHDGAVIAAALKTN